MTNDDQDRFGVPESAFAVAQKAHGNAPTVRCGVFVPTRAEVRSMAEAGRSVFVAVGALHMVGASGLPAALAREGFEVRRIPLGAGLPR